MNFELTKQQLSIIEAPEDKIVVSASAGTSKTLCMTERIKYLVRGGADPSKIVAITFTRNAAQEITSRLDGIKIYFCGTVHAFANYLLLCHGINTKGIIDEEDFDSLFDEIKHHPECIKRDISNLFLDEAQDSNGSQLDFLLYTLRPARWMLMQDQKQCIYAFNGAEPELMLDLMKCNDVTTYEMTENFRNGRNIHKYAKESLEYSRANMIDDSKPMRQDRGQVIKIDYDLDYACEIIESIGEPRDWFVLAFSNKEVQDLISYFSRKGIKCDTFKQGELKNSEIKDKLNQNTVKVLTCHSSKGLESKNVMIFRFKQFEVERDRLYYVACTRAKDLLVIVPQKPVIKKKTYTNWE